VTLRVGASGFSFATWRPGFYPAGTKPADFLAYYAERLGTVEVNGSFYRLPTEATFAKWAAAVPDGFRFAVKAPRTISVFGRVDFVPDLNARVRALGDRLGPIVVRFADGRSETGLGAEAVSGTARRQRPSARRGAAAMATQVLPK
jgi:uncharacterized protein YecE (DUF72 family)